MRLSRLSRGVTAQAATALEPLHDNLAMAPVRLLLCCTATHHRESAPLIHTRALIVRLLRVSAL